MPFEEANRLSSFLLPMMRLHPDKRANARDLLDHAWLEGVVVQGEIEARIRQSALAGDVTMEDTDNLFGESIKGADQDAQDALKPVSEQGSPGGVHLDNEVLRMAQEKAAEHQAQGSGSGSAGQTQTQAQTQQQQSQQSQQNNAPPSASIPTTCGQAAPAPGPNASSASSSQVTPRAAAQPTNSNSTSSSSPGGLPRPVATTVS